MTVVINNEIFTFVVALRLFAVMSKISLGSYFLLDLFHSYDNPGPRLYFLKTQILIKEIPSTAKIQNPKALISFMHHTSLSYRINVLKVTFKKPS